MVKVIQSTSLCLAHLKDPRWSKIESTVFHRSATHNQGAEIWILN